MSSAPETAEANERLRRCLRDLVALTALPSSCIGRSLDESLDILIDALPTALDCELVYLWVPGQPPHERALLRRRQPTPAQLAEIRAITTSDGGGTRATVAIAGEMWRYISAHVPMGETPGRLLVGRQTAFDEETDRVLLRTAANLLGSIVDNANALEVARRKDDFLAMLGHELRNPLAPIVTAVDLLKYNPTADREREIIERHSQHLVRIVDDLLDISRVTRGHVELRREHVTLASVLQRAVEIAAPLVNRHRHHMEVEDAGGVIVQGDPIRLAQIFGNLLTNAAKFTPPGGRIAVLVTRSSGRVRVTVRDTGCGIASDQLQRIFEPFVQADRARDVLRGGLGLGLAIVKSLVERHGGSISVQSEGRGRGSAFTVELPIATEVPAGPKLSAAKPSDARAQVRVLVVDDDPDITVLLGEALQAQGFQTALANDGRSALATWRTFQPHAAVLDVGLPDIDGCELARTIRSEHGRQVALIAVTGYGQPTDRVRLSEAGFDCHFVKPVAIAQLVQALDLRVVRDRS